LSSGCVSNWGELALLSMRDTGITYPLVARDVSGEDCAYSVLGFPAPGPPSLERAVRSAVSSVSGGALMTDLSIDRSAVGLVVFARVCVRVTGDVRSFE